MLRFVVPKSEDPIAGRWVGRRMRGKGGLCFVPGSISSRVFSRLSFLLRFLFLIPFVGGLIVLLPIAPEFLYCSFLLPAVVRPDSTGLLRFGRMTRSDRDVAGCGMKGNFSGDVL
jgi:hypothetical protein